MNFTQMHERLRLEILRRIQRGSLSVSLLARQTGFGQSHISNFLHSRRQLSLEAMDRLLAAQHLTPADLLPALQRSGTLDPEEKAASYRSFLTMPPCSNRLSGPRGPGHAPLSGRNLRSFRSRPSGVRRAWERFVAIRIGVRRSADGTPCAS